MEKKEQPTGMTTVLYIGGGRPVTPSSLTSRAERVVAIQADPAEYKRLRHEAGDNDRIEVLQGAVSDQAGIGTLRLFNLPQANSLRAPTGIQQIFPGLRENSSVKVDCLDASEVASSLAPSAGGHKLIVDLAGEEYAILKRLADTGRLSRFSTIRVHTGAFQLYETAGAATAVLKLLETAGFEHRLEVESDPDLPVVVATATASAALKSENAELSEQLSKAQDTIKTLEAALKEMKYRQTRIDEEFLRAEGQVALIRDILLRDKTL